MRLHDVCAGLQLAMISSVAKGERESEVEGAVWGPTDGVWSVLIPLISSLSFIGLSTLGAIGA